MTERRPEGDDPGPTIPPPPPAGFAGPPSGFAGAIPPTVAAPPATDAPTPSARPSRRRPIVPLVLAIVAVALAALGASRLLGGDDADPPPSDAAGALATIVDARGAGQLCSRLTEGAKAGIEEASGSPCRESLRVLFAAIESADPGPFVVTGVELDGDLATVRFRWELGDGTVPLVLVDGTWLVDSVDDLDPGGGGTVGADPTGSQQTCLTEQRTVETAVAAFEAMNGEGPSDAQALVDAGLLREAPTLVEVRPDGSVAPIGPCA
ncbi:MAG: hypothetical protein R2702_03095 [Acidimicrobiales bacterium]